MIEPLKAFTDMASNERSIPTKHSNSIPVSVSSPSLGVNHSSVGLLQKFSSIDELTKEMFQMFSLNETYLSYFLKTFYPCEENSVLFLDKEGGGGGGLYISKIGTFHFLCEPSPPHTPYGG